MFSFTHDNGEFDWLETSDGYTDITKVNDNTFYFVYQDFKGKNALGQERRAIMFRKVTVLRK